MSLNFDYEFMFANSVFDEAEYAKCDLQVQNATERYQLIKSKVDECTVLLRNLPYLKHFSTFMTFEEKVYKLTLTK